MFNIKISGHTKNLLYQYKVQKSKDISHSIRKDSISFNGNCILHNIYLSLQLNVTAKTMNYKTTRESSEEVSGGDM